VNGGGTVGRLLTAAEVAELLGVPESWVRDHTRAGHVPHVSLGRYVRYRESDVLAWIDTLVTNGKPGVRGYDSRRRSPRAAGTAEGVTTPKE